MIARIQRGGSASRLNTLTLRPPSSPTLFISRLPLRRLESTVSNTPPSYPAPLPTHTPAPRATGLRLIARRSREGFAFVLRFKRTLLELFLWMICGSLALELKWMRRDFEEYKETVGVKRRKLEAELRELRRECGLVDASDDKVTEVTKSVAQDKSLPVRTTEAQAPSRRPAIY
ncbi:uncharacterized protein SPPG_06639 [Spizellomyces punctatus DAOM BR117]|uniref:Uncharacterized protein n=1 Tax=Spizellomyces punctatus (strain DAOM BR117) TaxID=645134 RepID=A0A0L0HBJ3_SPIPD|nr:uncharacterized protein SPPG_06639 [Spizellomyces punctatus DAOM BR117]KNC98239.1 hypothetical protein SPPG_06639 [Spizellomyces punctatus DAOM BR117]|eukprot:XP_016606279.1 hypothetical protein SPPG_06639 [Spizellomyces punctatus DAOM BR117]